MNGAHSKIRLVITLAMLLAWLGLVVVSIRSFWRSDRIALESLEPTVLDGQDLRFFHSYSALSSHGGFGLGIHDLIVGTKEFGRHFIWEVRADPRYPFLTSRPGYGTLFSGADRGPRRPSGTQYSTNLFPETLTGRYPLGSDEWSMQWGGFEVAVAGTGYDRAWLLIMPYWSLIIGWGMITAFPLGQQIRVRRGGMRLRAGLCPTCGYDLRATPDRCPECGTTPKLHAQEGAI